LAAEALAQVLRPIQQTFAEQRFDNLLIGLDIADDAAVYQVSEDLAIVVTLDFFTPIVDDPYAFGAIAAANSLSDVYAMGARPILALNVAALPKTLPTEISAEILRGGAEKALEAGIPVAGGHTVQDKEPKYGLVVLGALHPRDLTRKIGAQPGDQLLLSKPLGAGVVTTALMRDKAAATEVAYATKSMMQLNARAAAIAKELGAHAVTDVTGFGLLGHACEMIRQNQVGFRIYFDALPWLPGALRLAEDWVFPGGAYDNRAYFGPNVRFRSSLDEWRQVLCFGPETSGGLLMAFSPEKAVEATTLAAEQGLTLWRIGEAFEGEGVEVL